jgi:hypothetical protein
VSRWGLAEELELFAPAVEERQQAVLEAPKLEMKGGFQTVFVTTEAGWVVSCQ